MSYIVDNAIIMAAGTSSRFAPLSYEQPKALLEIKGEVLIERQIKQLLEAGIPEIIIVTGYKREKFEYLKAKYGVHIVINNEFDTRNNNGSIYAVRQYLKNSYICSADNWFNKNPFECIVEDTYYATVFSEGITNEWCVDLDPNGFINKIEVGGKNSWYMLGHVFWSEEFSSKFIKILEEEYNLIETRELLWEGIYKKHLDVLRMKIRKYDNSDIFEFDSLDELRNFDCKYINNSGSKILQNITKILGCNESDISNFVALKDSSNEAIGFTFLFNGIMYMYIYKGKRLEYMNNDQRNIK